MLLSAGCCVWKHNNGSAIDREGVFYDAKKSFSLIAGESVKKIWQCFYIFLFTLILGIKKKKCLNCGEKNLYIFLLLLSSQKFR